MSDDIDSRLQWWEENDPDFPRYCTREQYDAHLAEIERRKARERQRRQLMTATTDCEL